jgi:hypothetical protein
MAFVVKAIGLGFNDAWLSPKSDIGAYTLGPRQTAVVFPTDADAQGAIVEATASLAMLRLVFSVESAD